MPDVFELPREVAQDPRLTPRAKVAYAVLRTLASDGRPFAWSDVERALGERADPSALDVIRKALARAGYVRESKNGLAFVLEIVE